MDIQPLASGSTAHSAIFSSVSYRAIGRFWGGGARIKKLYSLCYNLHFIIITMPSEAFFILTDKFIDACGVSYWVFFFLFLLVTSFFRLSSL